jgi:serine/threonine protein phosphatase PrpC
MDDDPAPPEESTGEYALLVPSPRPTIHYDVGVLTHAGLSRPSNEDHFLVARLERRLKIEACSLSRRPEPPSSSESGLLILVADGMGGVGGGERASRLAVETLESFILSSFRSFLHDDRADEKAISRELSAGFERADRIIFRSAATEPTLDGMGTTLTMAYIVADVLHVVHAGDSRAYVFREGILLQITHDHSLVQSMIDQGILSAEDARTYPHRNVVMNVLGGPSEGVEAEVSRVSLRDGDMVLLCTDGLTEPVDDVVIAAILGQGSDLKQAASALVEEALRRGGPDNVTAVIARIRIES